MERPEDSVKAVGKWPVQQDIISVQNGSGSRRKVEVSKGVDVKYICIEEIPV